MSYLVGNPKDWFSHNEAHTIFQQGGDADTNAAVAGALLGCKLGSRDHMPETWLHQLKHRDWLDEQTEL